MIERLVRGAAVVGLVLLLNPGIAHADPPGPTDYLTDIVAVDPPIDGAAAATIEGGDAFVQLVVEPGHTVEVLGYRGEPYLRFDPDGTVWQNRMSEAPYYNDERYGGDIPEFADPTASPEWEQVASGGTYAWHDHRAHWMSTTPLAGLAPGDALPRETIDLIVDGVETTITVETVLQPAPSQSAAWFGALGGVMVAATAIALAPARRWAMAVAGAIVLAVGIGQFFAVPPTTGPSWVWIALPALSLACALAALVVDPGHFSQPVWLFGAGIVMLIWAYRRYDVIDAAFVPNALGGAVDRAATTGSAIVGLVLVGLSVWAFGLSSATTRR